MWRSRRGLLDRAAAGDLRVTGALRPPRAAGGARCVRFEAGAGGARGCDFRPSLLAAGTDAGRVAVWTRGEGFEVGGNDEQLVSSSAAAAEIDEPCSVESDAANVAVSSGFESENWRFCCGLDAGGAAAGAVVALDAGALYCDVHERVSQRVVAAACGDGTLRVWALGELPPSAGEGVNAACAVATPSVKALPLSVAVARIGGADGGWVVAAGCTDGTVRLYELVSNDGAHDFDAPPTVRLMPLSTLGGHSGWVTALDFEASTGESGGALLVSASQDSTARVWRLRAAPQETQPHAQDGGNDASDASAAVSLGASLGLSSRDFAMSAAFSICGGGMACEAGLDGVLEGHRDWVTSARLRRGRVLTASGDRTVTLWAKREHSIGGAAWVSEASLGEAEVVSNLQGFYGAVFLCDDAVAAGDFLGSVQRWRRQRGGHSGNGGNDGGNDGGGRQPVAWEALAGCGGFTRGATALAWAPSGEFLLAAGADRTARVWARSGRTRSCGRWHEIARPQVHGHAIATVAFARELAGGCRYRYLCGSEEKAVRAYDAPQAFLGTLERISAGAGVAGGSEGDLQLPLGAAVPALGLSQRPLYERDLVERGTAASAKAAVGSEQYEKTTPATPAAQAGPPLEAHLALSTLWPECAKLYGHGDRIVALAAANVSPLVATAAAATAPEFARVRLWRCCGSSAAANAEGACVVAGPPLAAAHSVAVVAMAFSPDDRYLATVGRDRALCVFRRVDMVVADNGDNVVDTPRYAPLEGCPIARAHQREPRAVAWLNEHTLASGGRDKKVVVWRVEDTGADAVMVSKIATIDQGAAVGALAVRLGGAGDGINAAPLLAVGTDDGGVSLWAPSDAATLMGWTLTARADAEIARHSGAVRAAAFGSNDSARFLATCGDDGAVVISEVLEESKTT